MKKFNIVFMGTPDFALPALRELAKVHNIVAVYTKEPKEQGRGLKLSKSPIHAFAEMNNISVHTPKNFKTEEALHEFEAIKADCAVVCAYGLILPKRVLEAYPMGCINIHGSLLPRWRGAAPIHRAIIAGDAETGITIMQLDEGLDTGDMLLKKAMKITPQMTGGELYDAMAELGAEAILKYFEIYEQIKPQAQTETTEVTYAEKIKPDEEKINFLHPATEIYNQIRAFNPYPATYFDFKGERVKVYSAEIVSSSTAGVAGQVMDKNMTIICGEGAIRLLEIQRAGKKRMKAADFFNGAQIKVGEVMA